MNKTFFTKQLDDVITDHKSLKSRATYYDLSGNVGIEEVIATMSKAKAAVFRVAGIKSEYYKDIEAILKRTNINDGEKLNLIIGSVMALRSDVENDYMKSLNEIIQSEVFADYLEMAEHLLTEGYKDPAAVLIGSTLEAHLKELAKRYEIEVEYKNAKGNVLPKKADLLNSDLAKARIYSSLYQKQVVAWFAIRNSAAHGKYSDYTIEEVKLMLQGIMQFIMSTK